MSEISEYKEECMRRFKENQKYQKYEKEDLIYELYEKNNLLQQKENIIKEVREYIEHENFKRNILVGVSTKKYTRNILNNILEILDKESEVI